MRKCLQSNGCALAHPVSVSFSIVSFSPYLLLFFLCKSNLCFLFVLDCTSAPKKWKLGCNSCDVIINIFNKASKVTVNDSKQCDECQAQLVTVVYKADQTKFKDNAEEKTGCLFCSPDFIPLVEKHRAVATKPISTNSTRGGRGRGVSIGNGPSRGGGSSRGARGRPPKDKMAQLAAYFV